MSRFKSSYITARAVNGQVAFSATSITATPPPTYLNDTTLNQRQCFR